MRGDVVPAAAPGPFLRDARAVAFDPGGTAYVLDGDRGLCRAVGVAWACTAGADDARLVDPVALDASDALTVLVADRAGQVVRIDRNGVVRDRLAPPAQASRMAPGRPFAPVGVARDALGNVFALDAAWGLVRWDATRQFAVLVPPEQLPRQARALVRVGTAYAVLGYGALGRYDRFGTELERVPVPVEAVALAVTGETVAAVLPTGVRLLASGQTLAVPDTRAPLVGAAWRADRWCWLSATHLRCDAP